VRIYTVQENLKNERNEKKKIAHLEFGGSKVSQLHVSSCAASPLPLTTSGNIWS